jgi:hypothetical protein
MTSSDQLRYQAAPEMKLSTLWKYAIGYAPILCGAHNTRAHSSHQGTRLVDEEIKQICLL